MRGGPAGGGLAALIDKKGALLAIDVAPHVTMDKFLAFAGSVRQGNGGQDGQRT